jgi:CheY-like chemotaxis protein
LDNKPRILIVDDSAMIRAALTKQLEALDAKITQAEDGEQAWEEALRNNFDLIISDVDMPKLDGFSLCQRLKENVHTRGVPLIILSSSDEDKDIEEGFKAGATAYVSKSEGQAQLGEIVERVLKKSLFHRGRCVLVVDDSSIIRQLVSKALEEAGFQVIAAENGRQGMERIRERRPDIIVSDINMPEMDGMFVETEKPPAVGSIIKLIFSMGNLKKMEINAEVVWINKGPLSKDHGMGLKFLDMPAKDKDTLLKEINVVAVL